MATHTSLKDYIGIAPDFDFAASVEQGIPTENLNLLREKGLTFAEMATVIAPRTLKHRRAKGENLSSAETERAVPCGLDHRSCRKDLRRPRQGNGVAPRSR